MQKLDAPSERQHATSSPNHSPDVRPPFFILGSGRSGTSLVGRILGSHPDLSVPAESHLFNVVYPFLPYYGDLAQKANQVRLIDDILSTFHIRNWFPPLTREEILSFVPGDSFGDIVTAVMRAWTQREGKTRWGEKTPQHIYYWRDILHYFPQAQIIHVVRDGRDVALSYMKAKFGPKTVYTAARRWAQEMEEIAALESVIEPGRFYQLRYEDLLDNPRQEVSALCQFLGESFSPEMMDFHQQTTNTQYVEKVNEKNLESPLLKDNKEKWRRRMSSRDRRIFEALAGDTLEKFGYELSSPSRATLSSWEHRYYKYAAMPKKFAAMLQNRDGLVYEFARLRLFLRLKLSSFVSG